MMSATKVIRIIVVFFALYHQSSVTRLAYAQTPTPDPGKPPSPSDDICGRTFYCSNARDVDRLVNMSFGVCGALYDQKWVDAGLPVECGCPSPTQLDLPKMHRVEVSISLLCARRKSEDPKDDARYDRENPSVYNENICRGYRRELYNAVIDGFKYKRTATEDYPNEHVVEVGPIETVYAAESHPSEIQAAVRKLEQERRQELRRRMGLYIGSYKDFSGSSFYSCVGGIDFMTVKLCPNVVPEGSRSGNASADKIADCKKEAIEKIRATLNSSVLSNGDVDDDGKATVDWWNPSSDWHSFEEGAFNAAYNGGRTVTDGDFDTRYPGRDYDYVSFEATVTELSSIPTTCRLADPDLDGKTDLRDRQTEFNNKVNERANSVKESYKSLINSAAKAWYKEKYEEYEKALEEYDPNDPNAGPAPTPPPEIVREDPAQPAPGASPIPRSEQVMLRIPCDRKCDLEGNQ
jgi:hypothetical protein